MKLTKENLLKRLRNWKTWVALFALIGMILESLGYTNFQGTLGKWEETIYTLGILLGVWSDHDGKPQE
ncbi:hypothetical protein MUG87_19460 [Ectobacillus sp. JY-23]|uniref:hypothetical protein n=1 Tax=Ectobacillus sp. JY-23 TaxID=2933872 RepID=UPI001FF1E516|nr:hypothetical protein [Ectobacillus sp. JY-23]UOY92559.1 hypothetical protein MUG87_19460 [Ectobacillus sp. JY-23]